MLFYCIVILVILFMFFGYLEYLWFFWIIFGSIGLNGLVYTKNRTESVNFLVSSDVIGSEPDPTGTELYPNQNFKLSDRYQFL